MDAWLKLFIAIASLAILLQMLILLGMYLQVRQMNERMTRIATDLHARLDPILSRLNYMLEDAQPRLASIAADAAEIAHVARSQAQKVDRLFAEAVDRLRMQLIRADQILTGALEAVEDAGTEIREKVLRPVQQASAFIKGVKAGLDFLRGHRVSPERAREQQDESLFI
jgi:hypothetical protein